MTGRRNGWSSVGLLATVTLMAWGVLGLSAGVFGEKQLEGIGQEDNLLLQASRTVIQELKKASFPLLVKEFGPGSDKELFWVDLQGHLAFSQPENPQVSGTITLFNNESAIPLSFQELSGSYDLNKNGTLEREPVFDYEFLPVRITLSVRQSESPKLVNVDFILCDREG